LVKGKQKAGAALGNGKQTICTSTLREGIITQTAELIALTQALQLAKEKNKNIYTDSR
jgi:ribonuclease HI